MEKSRHPKYVMAATITCFVLAALAQIIGPILYPPDFSREFPVYNPKFAFIVEFALAFDLIGLTIMGMKAEEDRYTLAAGGFTAQAISIGLGAAGLFEIIFVASREAYEKLYYIIVASNFLYFPSLLLIATYGEFKRWVRIAGFIASLPMLIATILFVGDYRDFVVLEEITGTGYILILLTHLFWSGNIYVNYRNNLRQKVD